MYVLAIDTATNSGGVALARNDEVVGMIVLKTPLRYSDNLIPQIDFLLTQQQLDLQAVGCLSVAVGPGSFTGLRIGLAVAKAIGQAGAIPAVGISTLEALAYRFGRLHSEVAVMVDARRQQIFGSRARFESGKLISLGEPAVAKPSDWLAGLPQGPCLFVGDGATLYRGAVAEHQPQATVLATDNRILEQLCILGYQRFAAGGAAHVGELQAFYIRPPDAAVPAG